MKITIKITNDLHTKKSSENTKDLFSVHFNDSNFFSDKKRPSIQLPGLFQSVFFDQTHVRISTSTPELNEYIHWLSIEGHYPLNGHSPIRSLEIVRDKFPNNENTLVVIDGNLKIPLTLFPYTIVITEDVIVFNCEGALDKNLSFMTGYNYSGEKLWKIYPKHKIDNFVGPYEKKGCWWFDNECEIYKLDIHTGEHHYDHFEKR